MKQGTAALYKAKQAQDELDIIFGVQEDSMKESSAERKIESFIEEARSPSEA